MEFEGRGHELTEYLIGVEALGRPSNYSPGDDSAVRNRAFALRKKLQEFYEHENQEAPVRIELLKGSYCPHFNEAEPHESTNGKAISLTQVNGSLTSLSPMPPIVDAPTLDEPTKSSAWRKSLPGFLTGVFVTALIALAGYWVGETRTSSISALHN